MHAPINVELWNSILFVRMIKYKVRQQYKILGIYIRNSLHSASISVNKRNENSFIIISSFYMYKNQLPVSWLQWWQTRRCEYLSTWSKQVSMNKQCENETWQLHGEMNVKKSILHDDIIVQKLDRKHTSKHSVHITSSIHTPTTL